MAMLKDSSGNDSRANVNEILAGSMQFVIEGPHEILDNIRMDLVNYMMAGLRSGLKQGRLVSKNKESYSNADWKMER